MPPGAALLPCRLRLASCGPARAGPVAAIGTGQAWSRRHRDQLARDRKPI